MTDSLRGGRLADAKDISDAISKCIDQPSSFVLILSAYIPPISSHNRWAEGTLRQERDAHHVVGLVRQLLNESTAQSNFDATAKYCKLQLHSEQIEQQPSHMLQGLLQLQRLSALGRIDDSDTYLRDIVSALSQKLQFHPQLLEATLQLYRDVAALSLFQPKFSAPDWTAAIQELRLAAARLARKSSNTWLAQRMLFGLPTGAKSLDKLTLTSTYEKAKLDFVSSAEPAAFDSLCEVANVACASRSPILTSPEYARILLRLARWTESDKILPSQIEAQTAAFTQASIMLQPAEWQQYKQFTSSDALAGTLIQAACTMAPSLPKCHAMYASWCFRQARKCVTSAGCVQLTASELARARDLVYSIGQSTQLDAVVCVLTTLNADTATSSDFDEDIVEEVEPSDADVLRLSISRRIAALLPSAPLSLLDQFCELWDSIRKRVQLLFKLSASSYFSFLQFGVSDSASSSASAKASSEQLIASLRILRLLAKYGHELQSTFTAGFDASPTHAWKNITPQLFARLGHREPFVQQTVLRMLCRIGESHPHLIVYPAVVGRQTEGDAAGQPELQQQPDFQPFTRIVESLSRYGGGLVLQLEAMMQELRRITVLWDEEWLDFILQRQPDIARRLSQLQEEADRVLANATLSSAQKQQLIESKHAAIMAPVLTSMDKLRKATFERGPETAREKAFCDDFGQRINAGIQHLNMFQFASYNAKQLWQPLQKVFDDLKAKSSKKSSLELDLADISPRLAALSHTVVSMPGIAASDTATLITIIGFKQRVQIISSKTKPKKLVLLGSDGREYTYLFKGTEDLHLDERMMQFFDIVNIIFGCTEGRLAQLQARNYHVIPLGARTGLIQWVDGATPAYALYKHWQQREHQIQLEAFHAQAAAAKANTYRPGTLSLPSKHASAQLAPMPPPPPLRSNEQFYQAVTPLLKQHGLSTTASRSKWPVEALTTAFEQLAAATPSDLISRFVVSYL